MKITKEQIKILEDKAYGFCEEMWDRFCDEFCVIDLEDLDASKFEAALNFIKKIAIDAEIYEDNCASKD